MVTDIKNNELRSLLRVATTARKLIENQRSRLEIIDYRLELIQTKVKTVMKRNGILRSI